MRPARVIVPTSVAAVLWLVSGLAAAHERQNPAWTLHRLASVFAPATVRPVDLLSPPPWGTVIATASTLTLAAVYTLVLLAVRRRDRSAGSPVLTAAGYWFCAVLAGAAVAAVPAIVEVLAPAAGAARPSTLALDQVSAGVHWGLGWGWLPARAAAALDPGPDGPPPAPRRPVAVAAAVIGVVAAALLALGQDRATDARNEEAAAAQDEPEPVVTGEPVPPVAPGEWQIDPLWCTDAQLELAVVGADAATGARYLGIEATNVSDASCMLEGYPDLAFADPLGADLHVGIDHGGTTLTNDPGVTRLDVVPGGVVGFEIGWRGMPAGATDPAGWLHVAPYHGATRQMVIVETDITGGRVSTTAWHAVTD